MANIKIPDLSQATNLQDSDLLVLEQGTGTNKIELGGLFNAERGLKIDSDGISNVFADLSSVDVNTVQYNYQGYVANCTNLPTGYTHGQLICITGTGTGAECEQIYSPWNENLFYIRAYYGNAWTNWKRLGDCYMAGDTIDYNISGALITNGYMWSSAKSMRFFMNFGKEIYASSATITAMTLYAFGPTGLILNAVDVVNDTNYTITTAVRRGGIRVYVNKTTAYSNVSDNDCITLDIGKLLIELR